MRFWKGGKMRSRLLNRGVFEAVRLSEPSQNLVSSSQLPICSSQPLPEVSSLERTPSRDLSAWSTLLVRSTLPDLEQFARANSTSLKRTLHKTSFARASLLLRSSPHELNQSARANSLSARANCTKFLGLSYCFQIWYFKVWMGCFNAHHLGKT